MAEVTIQDVPRKVRDIHDKGFTALERANLDYAMDLFLSALELEPRFLLARKYLRAAEFKKFRAKKLNPLTHALATIIGLPQLIAGMGVLQKDPAKALRIGEKLLRRDPLNMPFIKLVGQAAVAAELPEVAVQLLEVVKEFYPKDPALLAWLGDLYVDTKQPEKARDCFDELVKLSPTDQKAIKSLKDATALATMERGGWDEAQSYRDVIKDTKESALLEQDSKAVKSKKDIESLIDDTLKKCRQEPGNTNYKRALADLYTRVGRFDEALGVLREAIQAAGGSDPQLELAVSRIRVQQFDTEIAALEEAGDSAGAKAKTAEKDLFVLTDTKERVRRYPNDLQFRYDLAVLLFAQGELNEAIQQFQQAQRNPQRRISALYHLGMCFKQKQQSDIAMEQFQKAASEIHGMTDDKKDILYQMGVVSEAMGNSDKAAEYYKEIYAVDIGYKDIAAKIDKVYKK